MVARPTPDDVRAARRRWDDACAKADAALRGARADEQERAEPGLGVAWFTEAIGQLAVVRARVNGKLTKPTGRVATGLFHDVPIQMQDEVYTEPVEALSEVDRLYSEGLDLPGWDWSRGWPKGWPVSLKDRLRAVVTVDPI